MVVKAIFAKAQSHKNGVRYDPAFLLECVLLRIKCKKGYTHLRENKILPLPDPSTIRKLLSCMPCTFGLNGFALAAIKKQLAKQAKKFRLGTLSWDEFSIQEDYHFDSKKLEFDGLVEYGSEGLTIKDKSAGKLADHALVFIFRPYLFEWIQPIACYATRGACPAELFQELMARAITALELNDAIVKTVVCDGAQSNKGVMKICGVDGNYDSLVNSFENQRTTDILLSDSPPTKPQELSNDSQPAKPPDLFEDPPPDKPPDSSLQNCRPTTVEKSPTAPTPLFDHPTVENELIFFLIDVPHLIKCIRNHIFNKKNVQVTGFF